MWDGPLNKYLSQVAAIFNLLGSGPKLLVHRIITGN